MLSYRNTFFLLAQKDINSLKTGLSQEQKIALIVLALAEYLYILLTTHQPKVARQHDKIGIPPRCDNAVRHATKLHFRENERQKRQ